MLTRTLTIQVEENVRIQLEMSLAMAQKWAHRTYFASCMASPHALVALVIDSQ